MRTLVTIGKIITKGSIFFLLLSCLDNKERKWLDSYIYSPYYVETIYNNYLKDKDKKLFRSADFEIMERDKIKATLFKDTSLRLKEIYFYFPYRPNQFDREGGCRSRYLKNNNYWYEESLTFSNIKYTKYQYNDYDKKGRLIRSRTATHRNLDDDDSLIEHDILIEYNDKDLPIKVRLLNHPLRLPDSIFFKYNSSKELIREIEYYSPNQNNLDSTYINYSYEYIKTDSIRKLRITYKNVKHFGKHH